MSAHVTAVGFITFLLSPRCLDISNRVLERMKGCGLMELNLYRRALQLLLLAVEVGCIKEREHMVRHPFRVYDRQMVIDPFRSCCSNRWSNSAQSANSLVSRISHFILANQKERRNAKAAPVLIRLNCRKDKPTSLEALSGKQVLFDHRIDSAARIGLSYRNGGIPVQISFHHVPERKQVVKDRPQKKAWRWWKNRCRRRKERQLLYPLGVGKCVERCQPATVGIMLQRTIL